MKFKNLKLGEKFKHNHITWRKIKPTHLKRWKPQTAYDLICNAIAYDQRLVGWEKRNAPAKFNEGLEVEKL